MIASPQRARADLIGEKDTISPHHRGRNAEPRKWCLPGDVLVTTPLHRESCFIAYSSAVRASPLRPVHRTDRRHGQDRAESSSHSFASLRKWVLTQSLLPSFGARNPSGGPAGGRS